MTFDVKNRVKHKLYLIIDLIGKNIVMCLTG